MAGSVQGKFTPFGGSPGLIGGPPKPRGPEAIVPVQSATAPSTATKAALTPRRNTPKRGKLS
jgi:hypothetical protein